MKLRPGRSQSGSIWQAGRPGLSGLVIHSTDRYMGMYACLGPYLGRRNPLKVLEFGRRLCSGLQKANRWLSFYVKPARCRY
jgi:hypothetical protein